MEQHQSSVTQFGTTTMPAFFLTGLKLEVDNNQFVTNIPGFSCQDGMDKRTFGLSLSKFTLAHYHPEAAHDDAIVEAFFDDCVSALLDGGGTVPHESTRDWLFFHNQHNAIVDH